MTSSQRVRISPVNGPCWNPRCGQRCPQRSRRQSHCSRGVTGDDRSRVIVLVSEACRHGKAIGAWAGVEAALQSSGVPADAAGVVAGDNATAILQQLTNLVAVHRVWRRFTTID
ncbi:hypothetical protein ACWEO4_47255 [Streptomyces sp. NPDC004393]